MPLARLLESFDVQGHSPTRRRECRLLEIGLSLRFGLGTLGDRRRATAALGTVFDLVSYLGWKLVLSFVSFNCFV